MNSTTNLQEQIDSYRFGQTISPPNRLPYEMFLFFLRQSEKDFDWCNYCVVNGHIGWPRKNGKSNFSE